MQKKANASEMIVCEDKLKNELLGNIGEVNVIKVKFLILFMRIRKKRLVRRAER